MLFSIMSYLIDARDFRYSMDPSMFRLQLTDSVMVMMGVTSGIMFNWDGVIHCTVTFSSGFLAQSLTSSPTLLHLGFA